MGETDTRYHTVGFRRKGCKVEREREREVARGGGERERSGLINVNVDSLF